MWDRNCFRALCPLVMMLVSFLDTAHGAPVGVAACWNFCPSGLSCGREGAGSWLIPLADKGGSAGSDPELSPELSPEEKRVLERKLKKERKKKERKRLREAGMATAQHLPAKRSGAQLALDYLCGWAQKQGDWRFQKTRQTWLLVHMYDSDQVPDEHFPTLLAYLAGLKGQARELTVQKAEALMRELDEAGAGSPDRPLLEKTRRIRQVLQLLS